jgi:hypothetical protein
VLAHRFALAAFGTENGMHTPQFAGQVMLAQEGPVQSSAILPTLTRVVDIVASGVGNWTVVCAVHSHFRGGMLAQLQVVDPNAQQQTPAAGGRRALA